MVTTTLHPNDLGHQEEEKIKLGRHDRKFPIGRHAAISNLCLEAKESAFSVLMRPKEKEFTFSECTNELAAEEGRGEPDSLRPRSCTLGLSLSSTQAPFPTPAPPASSPARHPEEPHVGTEEEQECFGAPGDLRLSLADAGLEDVKLNPSPDEREEFKRSLWRRSKT